jgi:acyl-coenzyme A synthetase/AMP-(fatty) acid ligase
MGRLDDEGRVWFLGRKTHRIFTKSGVVYPVQVEALFNRHSHVARSALVGVGPKGEQIPVLVVEPVPGVLPMLPRERRAFIADLEKIAAENPLASDVRNIFIIDALPVDIRHNAKIDRLALAKWAGKRSIST